MKNYWLGNWGSEEEVKDENENTEIPNEKSVEVIWAGHKIEMPN